MKKRLAIIFFLLILLGVGFLLMPRFLYGFFYYPDRVEYTTPRNAGLAYEPVIFKSADGTQLSGWFVPARGVRHPHDAMGTIIHMHGNARNMTAHWRYVEWVPDRGYNLFVFDYRGYGRSDGSPGPKGVFEDAIAALDYVRSRKDVDAQKLFVFGQSLGGMIALASSGASPKGIRAVVVEAPFYSYTLIANDHAPGAGLFLKDTYSAAQYVAKIAPIPLLLIHGTDDTVVPYAHSERLIAKAGKPKRLETIEGGAHNDAMLEHIRGLKYRDLMIAFFESALPKR